MQTIGEFVEEVKAAGYVFTETPGHTHYDMLPQVRDEQDATIGYIAHTADRRYLRTLGYAPIVNYVCRVPNSVLLARTEMVTA